MDNMLFETDDSPAAFIVLANNFWLRDEKNGIRCIGRQSVPLIVYDRSDTLMDRYAMVWLHKYQGLRQRAVARAFCCTQNTVSKWCLVYEKEGIPGLESQLGRKPKTGDPVDKAIRKLHGQGLTNPFIGQAVQLTAEQVRGRLRRMGLKSNRTESVPQQGELPLESPDEEVGEAEGAAQDGRSAGTAQAVAEQHIEGKESEETDAVPVDGSTGDPTVATPAPANVSFDADPLDRKTDRAMAAAGLLREAAPAFTDGSNVQGAGALLVLPVLGANGVLDCFEQVYGSLKPSFYGLRTTVLVLFVCAFLRIQRVEHLKKWSPVALGRLLGLDRAPEMKTVRRKLTEMAERKRAAELMATLAEKRYNSLENDRVGILYVDGHVREYFGKHRLPKTHVARRNHADKGTTDMWVNDAGGDPVFLVTCEVNQTLTQKLEEVVAEVRAFCGEDRPLTLVFDRGGWSPALFARLRLLGVHILTYRKGNSKQLPEEVFYDASVEIEGKEEHYKLHQMSVRMGKESVEYPDGTSSPLWLRQVSRLKNDGKQTEVLTSRQDLSAAMVLWLMFNRWRQENFLKYMRTEYLLDAMPEYGCEEISTTVDCPNPAYKQLGKDIAKLQARSRRLAARLGQYTAEADAPWWRTLRCHREADQETVAELRRLGREIEELQIQRLKLPQRIPARDVYHRLHQERKLITDAIKMSAYQQESRLLAMLRPHYARCDDEGRKLLAAAFGTPGDICVRGDELRITLAPQYSPHRTRAIAGLCEELNRFQAVYPGTNLRLHYTVRQHN